MALLNYSTTIEAAKTVSEIEAILSYHHATHIAKDYDGNGHITALTFEVDTPQGVAAIRLPVNPDAVLRIMQREQKAPRHLRTREQAMRVAWRIIKEWVAAQMALLETEQVKMEQIFLAYILTDKGNTLFEVFEGRRLLASGRTQETTHEQPT